MLRKNVIISLVGLFVLTLGVSVAARAESKQEIDVAVSDTLQRFTSANPAHAELLRKAAGVLVFQGAGGAYDSETLKKPILGFVFDEKGLIGDLSLKGSKIKQIEPK